MAKPKTLNLGGVTWKLAEVEWEDAYKANKAPLKTVLADKVGPQLTAWGYTAKVGNYRVILHQYSPHDEAVDVTVVPLHAKVEIRYV